MGEIVERAVRIAAGGAGGTVGQGVGGLLALAAAATNNPELAAMAVPVGALTGMFTEEAVLAVRQAWKREGVQAWMDHVEDETGEPLFDMLEGVTDRKTRRLLGESVAAATETADEWSVGTLAQAFVVGARDPAKVDPMRDLVRVLPGVEGKHARVMAVLAQSPFSWTVDDVAIADPGLGHTVAILARDLERLGLVSIRGNVASLSIVGWSCAALLKDLGSMPVAHAATSQQGTSGARGQDSSP